MISTNKRKEAIASEEAPKIKLSREARKRKNKRLKWELEHKEEPLRTDVIPTANSSAKHDIIFDLLRVC